jgi:transcriptional regulator with XRE-family HTH domain
VSDEALITLGLAIQQLRVARGLSVATLAEEAGIHRNYLRSVESGERNVSVMNLRRIAHALGMTLAELVEKAFTEETKPPS